MRIVTWNTGRGGVREHRRGPTPDDSLGDIARRAAGFGADVLCLQEVRSQAQLDTVLTKLGAGWHGRLTRMPKSDRDVAVITERRPGDRFQEVQAGTGRCGLLLSREAGKRRFHVLAVHAHAYSSQLRRAYLEAMVRFAEALPEDDPVLLLGDLNLDPLVSAFTYDRHALGRLRRSFRPLLARRVTTCLGVLQLDHAFVRRRGGFRWLLKARVLRGTRAYGRDHDPVQVDVRAPE
ncbi:MAG: endonuclease/exonuclease/phosphatase family protein [Planctomycetota bacterium]